MKGPAEAKVAGVEKPILDMLREKAPETHRKDGQNLNLKAEKVVNAGTFKAGNGWQEVRFAQPVAGRYFCLEGISNYEGNNIAAIAELDVLDNNGKPVSRENWKIMYADPSLPGQGQERNHKTSLRSKEMQLQGRRPVLTLLRKEKSCYQKASANFIFFATFF